MFINVYKKNQVTNLFVSLDKTEQNKTKQNKTKDIFKNKMKMKRENITIKSSSKYWQKL